MKTKALDQLFGCYFHQDWHDEYPDETAALNAIVNEMPKEYIVEGTAEIETILNAGLREDELSTLLMDKIGCYFAPASANLSYAEWLQRVRDFFKQAH